ncbi:BMP family lipoprotein [Alloiococcus sp. CFN-8]|uniref:BMP family lipoprotein n=1 Tax=Alloiococcus sp. CFN-8 TaxID=3416081 RepID=UPI003CE9527C
MKRLLSLLLTFILTISLVGCGGSNNTAGTQNGTIELALTTDSGTIDDKSFNQGAWEGLEKYASENNISYKYYQPVEKTTTAYLETIDLAVEGGAKIIACPGYLFAEAIYEAQDKYPDTTFIMLDASPKDANGTEKVNDNTYAVYYAEEQAGFLAGYAAVKDGYKKLGFMGGVALPAVVRFGYGFIQGAEYAAEEMGIEDLELKYHYTGKFDATPEAQSTAAAWYQSGTEVIFACGGAVGNSVMAAAEDASGKVIGVDVDQSAESDSVITSAIKNVSGSVYDGIKAFYNDSFPGGQVLTLDASVDAIGLAMDTSKFNKFTQEDYEAIYNKIKDGKIKIVNDYEAGISELNISNIKIDVVQ